MRKEGSPMNTLALDHELTDGWLERVGAGEVLRGESDG